MLVVCSLLIVLVAVIWLFYDGLRVYGLIA